MSLMMTMTDHPITPPPELVQQWRKSGPADAAVNNAYEQHIATKAAHWGSDQELLACGNYLEKCAAWEPEDVTEFYNYRRPKPPTLNSIALQMLGTIERDAHYLPEITETIRRALNELSEFPDSSDGPAVPEGREPVSVVSEPSDREPLEEGPSLEEVEELCEEHCFNVEGYESIECLQGLINDALARWGTPNQAEIRSSLGAAPAPPDEGEVGELVARLRDWHSIPLLAERERAAELLQRQYPQPVPAGEVEG